MSDYDRFARLYDLEHRAFTDDITLYHNFALRCDGPVLELGCGSGRVCLALARSGHDVFGVDNAAAMLSLARAHAAETHLSGQIRLEQIDVRNLVFQSHFALAIFPLNGFLHLLTVEDQLAALNGTRRALLPGGFLIIDLPNPHTVFTSDDDGRLLVRSRFVSSSTGRTITCSSISQTDTARQRQHLTLHYDEAQADGSSCRTTVETDLRVVYRYEMEALLRQAGFQVDAVYGSYDLDPYDRDSGLMLFVAYRPMADGGGLTTADGGLTTD